MKQFYQRLKSASLEREMSIEEASRKIGVAGSTLRDWEQGRKILGEPYLKIAKVYEVPVYWLLTGEELKIEIQNELKTII